jgi:hypothetical protein
LRHIAGNAMAHSKMGSLKQTIWKVRAAKLGGGAAKLPQAQAYNYVKTILLSIFSKKFFFYCTPCMENTFEIFHTVYFQ